MQAQIKYNINGISDKFLDNKLPETESVAMLFEGTTGLVYKVKMDKSGHIYNPINDGSSFDYGLNKTDKVTKGPKFVYREVNKKTFDLYIKFLQTRYDSWLLAAERELR